MTTDMQTRQLTDAITGAWRTRLIYESIRSGLIDSLGPVPRTAAECAGGLDLHAETTLRFLRALAALGLCRQVSRGTFAATELGDRLRAGGPGSLRGMALLWGDRIWSSLETIGGTLRTGEPGRGNGDFSGMHADPEASDIFNRAMAEQSQPVARAVAGACDFSSYDFIMDVGGGYGALLIEILRAHPALRGMVYDLEAIGPGALRYLAEAGVGGQASFVGGSFFESVPRGADCLLIKYILHDWPDADCLTILRHSRAALAPGAAAIVIERVVPETVSTKDDAVVRADLVMMPISGKERTLGEYHVLLEAAGFAPGEAKPLVDGCWAIESRAA
jgi:hypothetical protein